MGSVIRWDDHTYLWFNGGHFIFFIAKRLYFLPGMECRSNGVLGNKSGEQSFSFLLNPSLQYSKTPIGAKPIPN